MDETQRSTIIFNTNGPFYWEDNWLVTDSVGVKNDGQLFPPSTSFDTREKKIIIETTIGLNKPSNTTGFPTFLKIGLRHDNWIGPPTVGLELTKVGNLIKVASTKAALNKKTIQPLPQQLLPHHLHTYTITIQKSETEPEFLVSLEKFDASDTGLSFILQDSQLYNADNVYVSISAPNRGKSTGIRIEHVYASKI